MVDCHRGAVGATQRPQIGHAAVTKQKSVLLGIICGQRVAYHLVKIVHSVCATGIPTQGSEIISDATCDKKSMERHVSVGGVADDHTLRVDARSDTVIPTERTKIVDDSAAVEERMSRGIIFGAGLA